MYSIKQLTANALQSQRMVLPDGTTIYMVIRYSQQQYGWFIDTLEYDTFVLSGMRICNSPNLLHQFQSAIPFGLACFSKDDREPTQIEDLSSGATKLYILTPAEVSSYLDYLSGQ